VHFDAKSWILTDGAVSWLPTCGPAFLDASVTYYTWLALNLAETKLISRSRSFHHNSYRSLYEGRVNGTEVTKERGEKERHGEVGEEGRTLDSDARFPTQDKVLGTRFDHVLMLFILFILLSSKIRP
jgi:hypothetical protein